MKLTREHVSRLWDNHNAGDALTKEAWREVFTLALAMADESAREAREEARSKEHAARVAAESRQIMRDHFAGLAMQGLLASPLDDIRRRDPLEVAREYAKIAYHYADAMMTARLEWR